MNLYEKHVVYSSILFKNKEVLARNSGGKMKMKHLLYMQHVALRHDTLLHLVSSLGYPCSVTCPSRFGYPFYLSYDYSTSSL